MNYYVYILANNTNIAIYIGVTNNIKRRLDEHRTKKNPNSFTAKHNIHKLVYYEVYSEPYLAIKREKQLKGWNRKRKNKLISARNPMWKDLYYDG